MFVDVLWRTGEENLILAIYLELFAYAKNKIKAFPM